MKKITVVLIGFLLSIQAHPQKKLIDSLNTVLINTECSESEKAKNIYSKLNKLHNGLNYFEGQAFTFKGYAFQMFCLGLVDSAIYYFNESATYYERALQSSEQGRMVSNVAALLQGQGKYDTSLYYFDKALIIGKKTNDNRLVISAILGKGIVFKQTGELDSALTVYNQGEHLAIKKSDTTMLVMIRSNRYVFYDLYYKNRLEAKEMYETLEFARKIKQGGAIASLLQVIGFYELDLGNYSKSFKLFSEGLIVSDTSQRADMKAYCYLGLGKVLQKRREFEDSHAYLDSAEYLAENSPTILAEIFISKADNFYNEKKFNQAITYAHKSLKLAEKSNQQDIDILPLAHEKLAKSYEKVSDFEKAYYHSQQNFKLSKQLLDAEKSRQLTELETRFDVKQKNQEIQSLAQQSQIQELQLSQQRFFMVGIVILAFLLLGGGSLIYRQNQIKNRQEISEAEQKLLRTQMNPHFMFNSLTAIQQYSFQNNPEKAGIYMAKFAKLMRQILENSREDYITIAEEIDTLENYIQLQQLRFKDRFSYNIEVDNELNKDTIMIPPMFAQPFIENAVEHGLSEKIADGLITIKFTKANNLIRLEVNDNGMGISKSMELRPRYEEHKSLATTITRERLAIFNKFSKKKIELVIQDLKDSGGTSVQLLLPSITG